MKGRSLVLKVLPLLFCLAAEVPAPSGAVTQQPVLTTVCAIMANPGRFAGQVVKVKATVSSGFEFSTIIDPKPRPSCKSHTGDQWPWVQTAPRKNAALALNDYDADLQKRHPVFLVEDEGMRRFVKAVDAQAVPPPDRCSASIDGYPKYQVTATMTGRVDYSRTGGFGHLGAWHVRFLLMSASDVVTKELSYDYLKCPTTPAPLQNLQPPSK